MSLAIDGIFIVMPPSDPNDRYNYCRFGEGFIYRKSSEAMDVALAGDDPYGKQAKLARSIPMWGGCSGDGFGILSFHEG